MALPRFIFDDTLERNRVPKAAGTSAGGGEQTATEGKGSEPASEHTARQLRLPVLVADEDVGLGDLIKRITSAFGIKPCPKCETRAAILNQWIVFTHRR